jgi:hypothetical protein
MKTSVQNITMATKNIKNLTNERGHRAFSGATIRELFLLFITGGFIYGGIEILHREYTHFSMFITGGLCFVLIGALRYSRRDIPVTVRMFLGAVIITVLELACGLIVNVWLGWNVWDYSHEYANLLGQICLHATALWFFLSFVGVYFDVFFRRGMFGQSTPPMRILP